MDVIAVVAGLVALFALSRMVRAQRRLEELRRERGPWGFDIETPGFEDGPAIRALRVQRDFDGPALWVEDALSAKRDAR